MVVVAVLTFAALLLLAYQVESLRQTPSWNVFDLAGRKVQISLGQAAVALMLAALALVAAEAGGFVMVGTLAATVVLWFGRVWHREIVFLMSLRDDELPARGDKLVWVALLTLLPLIGVWAFRSFRRDRWPDPATLPDPAHTGPADAGFVASNIVPETI
ncbi:MAG: hypothetical protein KGM43_17545 [Planctomycetota bacterium]|nr:hypothetical protein [Planctomycetota bacterium]